jgi:hypothetical protein
VDGALLTLATAAVAAALLGALWWLARRVRRRGVGDRVAGPFDEIWHPSGRHTHTEVQEARERVVPAPVPDDPFAAGRPGERR